MFHHDRYGSVGQIVFTILPSFEVGPAEGIHRLQVNRIPDIGWIQKHEPRFRSDDFQWYSRLLVVHRLEPSEVADLNWNLYWERGLAYSLREKPYFTSDPSQNWNESLSVKSRMKVVRSLILPA